MRYRPCKRCSSRRRWSSSTTEEELKTKLREHGVTDPSEVEKAYIEPDGQVTVLKKKT
jgi:uncharacterized membrane protein YcaP (DUF421 family)